MLEVGNDRHCSVSIRSIASDVGADVAELTKGSGGQSCQTPSFHLAAALGSARMVDVMVSLTGLRQGAGGANGARHAAEEPERFMMTSGCHNPDV